MTVALGRGAGSRFWSSPEARVYRSYERRLRTRLLDVVGEPEGKGPRGTRALAGFRSQVGEQLRRSGRRAMTGPLALDLSFVSTRKTPTSIHQMAKWAIDALGGPGATGVGGAHSQLYRDDRQVKPLHVSLRQDWPGDVDAKPTWEARTIVNAQPLRDVLEDIRVMAEMSDDDDSDGYPRVDLNEGWDLVDLSPTADPGWARVNAFFADWGTFVNLELAQKALLIAMDRLVDSAMTFAPYHIAGARRPVPAVPGVRIFDEVERWQDGLWGYFLSSPLTLPLPGLPEDGSARRQFREGLRASLEKFLAGLSSFRHLVVPIKTTLMVVPPRQGKDLDNIALDVLPVVHEVLRPHVEPWLSSPIFTHFDDLRDPEARTEREKALKRLKSINSQSVTAFQVIELNRIPHHPPGGMLRLTFGPGDGLDHTTQSLWTRADQFMWERVHGRP